MFDDRNGEVTLLANLLVRTRKFAGSVVAGVRAGTEAELYKRQRRSNAVRPELLTKLKEFLLLPHISRSCPGETISVVYGHRQEKHRMCVSKVAALTEFRETHSCQLAISTLLQYWPPQFVSTSSSDCRRNICATHDNMP